MTDSERDEHDQRDQPDHSERPDPSEQPRQADGGASETPEEKRARVMRRLAEMIRAEPPDLSATGGPVSAGGFPLLPANADEFDQESASQLFAALGEFFQTHKKPAGEEGAEGVERE